MHYPLTYFSNRLQSCTKNNFGRERGHFLENTDFTSVNHSCPIFQDEIMVEIKHFGFML